LSRSEKTKQLKSTIAPLSRFFRWAKTLLAFCMGIGFVFFTSNLRAQSSPQWAAEVIGYSSQQQDQSKGAFQALGPPNSFGKPLPDQKAWVAQPSGIASFEYLIVGFSTPQPIAQVTIVESAQPGSIQAIWLIDTEGAQHLIYENTEPQSLGVPSRVFKHVFPLTNYQVASLRLELNPELARSGVAIDAIGISETPDDPTTNPVVPAKNTITGKGQLLPEQINSDYADFMPLISPDGQTLFFTRKFHPQNMGENNHEDIWITQRQGQQWNRAINAGAPLNNRQDNRIVGIETNGATIYLAVQDVANGTFTLYTSQRQGRSWSRPRSMPITGLPNGIEGEADFFVSADGRHLLLSYYAPESLGQRDLFVCFREENNHWSRPLHLGNTLNTVGTEGSAFLAPDGRTLYFASDGHPGEGGLDIYYTQRLNDSWTDWSIPRNLGAGINSRQNDYHFSLPAAGDLAFFVSEDRYGMANIYQIEIPQAFQPDPVVLVKGRLIESTSQRPVPGSLTLGAANSPDAQVMQTTESGEYQVILPYGEPVGIFSQQEGYLTVSQQVDVGPEPLKELDASPAYALEQNPEYQQNPELQRLMAQIQQIDKDLTALNREPAAPQSSPSKGRRTTKQQELINPDDPALEEMRAKYEVQARQETLQAKGGSGDAELDAMREKLKRAQEEIIAPSPLEPARPEQDAELEAMKDRFNDAHQGAAPSSRQQILALEEQTRSYLEQALAQSVWLELRQQQIPFVSTDLLQELPLDEQAALRRVLSRGIPPLEVDQLPAYITDVPAPPQGLPEWAQAYQQEYRTLIEAEIRQQLRDDLTDDLLAALERELLYLTKLEVEQSLKDQLQSQMAQSAPADGWQSKGGSPAPQPSYVEVVRDVLLVPIKPGATIPLNNVFFEANQPDLKPASFRELSQMADFLQDNPEVIIEVGGHTNGWCTHTFANELSTERARTVAEYLLRNGVNPAQVSFKGYGKSVPVATNETEEGRLKNQRVELTILATGL
jgi:OOP family OmpA-OmpF porin